MENCILSDEELVKRVHQGDEDALAALVLRYTGITRWRAGHYAQLGIDPDDLVQEGMIGLLQAIRRYDERREASFKTYAVRCIFSKITTAVNTWYSGKGRAMANYVSLDAGGGEELQRLLGGSTEDPGDVMILREAAAERNEQMARLLSELERNTLKLYLSGHSYEEMAGTLHLSQKSVDNALQRVRRKLRLIFQDNRSSNPIN